MRRALRGLGILVGVLIALGAALYVASESREVVILATRDEAGRVRTTHLWVVEDAGAPWLRSGGRSRGWFVRALARPEVELQRAGQTRAYRAVLVDAPEVVARVDARMREKYGWIDALILTLEGRPESVAVRLDPRP